MSIYSIRPFHNMMTDAELYINEDKNARHLPHVKLYRTAYTNYLKIHGKTATRTNRYNEAEAKRHIESMYRWYKEKYLDTANTTSEIKEDRICRTTSAENLRNSSDEFDDLYFFGKPYSKTMFSCYLMGKRTPKRKPTNNKAKNTSTKPDRPTVTFILHIAVAFKFTVAQCDDLLQTFGYFPLHSKNAFHLAVYCILRDIEKNKAMFQSDFDQFHRLKELYQRAIAVLRNPNPETMAYLKGEPEVFEGELSIGSSTQLMRFVQKKISSDHYVDFILRHKEEFNEQHSKVRKEYFRLLNIFMPFFDEKTDVRRYKRISDDAEDDVRKEELEKAIEEQQRVKAEKILSETGTSDQVIFNIDDCSLHAFIQCFCKSLSRKHYTRDLIQKISKEGCEPTREIMIILWTWEFIFLSVGQLELPFRTVFTVLSKAKKLTDDEEVSGKFFSVSDEDAVQQIFSISAEHVDFQKKLELLKEWKKRSTALISAEDRATIENCFPVKFSSTDNTMLVDTSKLLNRHFVMRTGNDPWGKCYLNYMNAKLNAYGLSILSTANHFDQLFILLKNIDCKSSRGETLWRYHSPTVYSIPGTGTGMKLVHFSTANQFGYPDGLRFLFLYLKAYQKLAEVDYPLECDIYKKL